MLYQGFYDSPVGKITIITTDTHLRGVYIEGQKYFLGSIKEVMLIQENPIIEMTRNWLKQYFLNEKPDRSSLPIEFIGTPFQKEVRQILCEIPYGRVITYKDIANKIADQRNQRSMSSQAVGQAVGHNPISIIVPCHRVVGSSGSLTGYAGGIDLKIKLLELEKVNMDKLFIPKK